MIALEPVDFRCWCTALPGEPCKPGASEAADQELRLARCHHDRLYKARDANAAIQRKRDMAQGQ